MRIHPNVLAIGGVVAALFAYSTLFVVYQTEYALKVRFGRVIATGYEPGLHLKLPFMDKIYTFDRRILTLEADAEHYLTNEKKNLIVDSYVKWRIIDEVKYYTTMGGNEERTMLRLTEIIGQGLRNKFGSRTIQQVISGERAEIMTSLTEEANKGVAEYGLEVVDVRIKKIELPKEVSTSVYQRMETERERVARELRSRGEAEAVRIRAEADRQRIEVLAQSQRDANTIRGEGDAQATKIYAEAFSQDQEFYRLYRSLEAYRATFADKSDILVLEPDSEFFKYFKQPVPAVP